MLAGSGIQAARGSSSGLLPAATRPRTSPAEQKVLDKVAVDLGPVVDAAEAPALYAALETTFARLSAAQEKLFPSDAVSVNRVRVLDTPVVNAFVYPLRSPGVRRSNNMVFVTTGLLKKMLGDDPARLKEGMTRVAGVLAHELAHPLDDIDAEGVLKNYGREAGGQAREIRADSEGAMIAKEAGYPTSCVYQSLERLFEDDGERGGAVAALAGTHPQDDLRLVMQRILLTLDRYDRGVNAPAYPEEVSPAVLRELDRVDKGARLGRFSPPRDLAQALERLKQVPLLKRSADDKKIEFNRLLLWVDAALARRKSPLDDEEFRLFTEIMRQAARPDSPEVLDYDGMKRLFGKDSYSEEFLAGPSHAAYMKKVPVYASPRYRDWLSANFLARQDDSHVGFEQALTALTKIAPADVLFQVFGARIAAELPAVMRRHPSQRYVYESISAGKSPEFQIRLAVLFHQKVEAALSPDERAAFYVGQIRDYSYVLPQFPYGRAKNRAAGLSTRRALFMGDPRLKDLQAEYRAALRSVWENRGYYGVLDLLAPFNRTDWNAIFDVLDIDPRVGRAQLRQAVKAYAASPDYASLLATMRDSSQDGFRLFKMGRAFGKDLTWLDDTLAASLSGDRSPALQADPALRELARRYVTSAYYASRPALFRRVYRAALEKALARGEPAAATVAQLGRVHLDLMKGLVGSGVVGARLADVQAQAIAGSPLSAESKRELLRGLYLEGHGEAERVSGLSYENAGDWLYGDHAKAVARVLVAQGVAKDAQDLLATLLSREDFLRGARKDGFSRYASAASGLKDELLGGLEAALSRARTDGEKADILTGFLATAVDPGDGDYPAAGAVNTPALRAVKERVVELSAPLKLTFAQSLELFKRLTGSGPTPATDAFFRRRLEPSFDEAAAEAAGASLPELLESGRIASVELQLELAKRALEPEITRLEPARTPAELSRLLETLNAFVRHGSLHKDEFLESLAWRLNLTGRELGAFIEDEKSYNWRKANPVLVRFGSALGAEIARLSPRGREDFIRFLIKPEGGRLPEPIFAELERNLYRAALEANAVADYPASPAAVREKADQAAELMRLEIEAALIDASPFERIPLYELLLSAGHGALSNAPDYPYGIMRTFLGYQKGSTEETMLAAFLEVVPPHERTVSLAYMLSQAGRDKSSVKNLFEVFQTVGIKFGQLSSTWKLFGDEIARQTAALKNDARPMTKAEVMEIARRELSPEEFARIKRPVKVLGSASLKTVVLVELQDGRQVVMMVRRPHAAEQIESNLRLGSAFLKELDRRGLSSSSALFETVLEAVRRQLSDELSLTREADELRAAERHYGRLNETMRAQLGPWRFRVPGLVDGFAVRDTVLFVEKAEGTTFDRLPAQERAAVGPLIADSSLNLLFRDGWFDADRHTGNQLIDPATRTIYPLDFGQALRLSRTAFWRGDDRYQLAQFLRALSAGDAAGVLRHGAQMSDRDPRDPEALLAGIRVILAGEGGLQEKIVALVGAFAEHGARLDDRFTFGAFKGLMTLSGESYLPDAGFRRSLSREIASLLRRKLPRTLSDARS